ncbi:hypothetical protein N7495_006750 [Penicillium taxi]|uniref:uncharacterized protein n=1 Tax=Penicillium taxi TaxID=168475 RepID=UPI0025459A1B|nr:uncharacterized protein N7495_006750 [Penicillium taxi]KAJ5895059.1 hypothetical protein N7495_006750 [Penicillium taxi]
MDQALRTFTPDSEFADMETPRAPNPGTLSITAMARFEFEAGKGNEGTKVLMIEWEDDDLTRVSADGSWHVSWAGKTTILPADERPNAHTRRFYFLLPPHTTIPPVVTLSYEPSESIDNANAAATPSSKVRESLQLNPLPAIFPPELGATGRAAGKKGVLHTIWGKKRLRVLEDEIENEALNNAEGIALHMAVQEKEWIETNFGVTAHGTESVAGSHDSPASNNAYPAAPATPVSPVSGTKLGDKLRGLKLQTSERELSVHEGDTFPILKLSPWEANRCQISGSDPEHLLSPKSPDVAVSSFRSFRNITNQPLHSMPTPNTPLHVSGLESLRAVAHFPPESVQEAQQNSGPDGFSSMNTLDSMSSLVRTSSTESGDDLFAKALSPRSPDLPRSPFSFA